MQEIFFWHLVFFIRIRMVILNQYLRKEKLFSKSFYKRLFVVSYTSEIIKDLKNDANGQNGKKGDENGPINSDLLKYEKSSGKNITYYFCI